MARQTAYYAARVRPTGFYRRLDDKTVLQQIRAVTNSRAGARKLCPGRPPALVTRCRVDPYLAATWWS